LIEIFAEHPVNEKKLPKRRIRMIVNKGAEKFPFSKKMAHNTAMIQMYSN